MEVGWASVLYSVDGQFSDTDGESRNEYAFKCCVCETESFQAEIDVCAEVCAAVCEGIPCESESLQATVVVLKNIAKGHILIITGAPTMIEAMTCHFRTVLKAPDKSTIVCSSD